MILKEREDALDIEFWECVGCLGEICVVLLRYFMILDIDRD